MYQPVFSLKTGWVLGEITDHTAHPINDSVRLDEICTKLNAAQDNIEAQHSSASPVQHTQLAIASMDKIADVLDKNHPHGQIYEVAKIVDEWRSATDKHA